jgi:large conductance mechanosensitive channel
MFKEFRKFILRGSVVDLAVGVVVGAAFTSVVKSLVDGVILPLISTVYGGTNLAKLEYITHDEKHVMYGSFISSIIAFFIVTVVVFFFVVQPVNQLTEKFDIGRDEPSDIAKKCPYCMSSIPKKATRCKYCTSKLDDKKD